MSESINSGVDGGSGYTFQRCCVVYLLFDDYEKLITSSIDYFICIEHHEDFLFAFIDENGNIENIDTYQAKKSRDDWKTDQKFCEIIGKISLVGKELINDTHPKVDTYAHTLSFLTNRNILLQGKRVQGKKRALEKIQISNISRNYSELNNEIKENIQSNLKDGEMADFNQLANVRFNFIDLPQSYKGWKRTLTGLSTEILGSDVSDHEAVITTLMALLQDVELAYNNAGYALLTEKSKRLTKQKINTTFNMFAESKKTFDFWRQCSEELSKGLQIKLPIKRKAKELLDNCFDFFKDIQQIEYKKIYKFVSESTDVDENHSSEPECIIELYQMYISEYNPRLEEHMVAFAIIAAYVETRGMYA
ncbi:hypothetical protein [Xenorhabdus anantnagensis]|uniref:CD-NTase associated protein 4-like DNA endonuclease domain-containing protein n=1 Tax=Xenorhabdus anantnagensis TaxID=3025875 RepID=A0ABT5LX39_9GAMM|nr:hypothetical protein [Xenorhabdus anantnagensis]MDC9598293.1 hypothetical protein [Xenorhabdus anantnagensis]